MQFFQNHKKQLRTIFIIKKDTAKNNILEKNIFEEFSAFSQR